MATPPRIASAAAAALIMIATPAAALRARSPSAVDPGRVLAQSMCAECHAVQAGQYVSPNPYAPSFERIANTPGMSAPALWSSLYSSHRRMPNIILRPDETRAIVSYILTLQDADD